MDDFALRIILLRNENFTSGNFPCFLCIDDFSIYPNKHFFSCMESTLPNPIIFLWMSVNSIFCWWFTVYLASVSLWIPGIFLLSSCLYVIHVHCSIYLTVLFNYRLVWIMKKSPSAGPPKGQKLCKNRTCKKVFSILDPHPSCTHCLPPRVCTRELPCEFCSPLSGEQWEEWERVLSKQKSYQARKKAGAKEVIPGGYVSTGISTEEVDVTGVPCRTPPPMTPASKKFN